MSYKLLYNRQPLILRPDPSRVIVRPFRPTVEPRDLMPTDKTRANHIVERVMGLEPKKAEQELRDVLQNFQSRHRNLLETFEARADDMEGALKVHADFSLIQRQLVGAYFMHEYAFEAAALFNPSIVAHPDQAGVAKGSLRFILSLRAVGEGHVSSLTFRSGLIGPNGTVTLEPSQRLASLPKIVTRKAIRDGDKVELAFNPTEDISERVIFPVTVSQSNGIEDARFVAFEDKGHTTFYATYTAYSGLAIRSEMMETSDFVTFRMTPLEGDAAHNKGMALFPRKVAGKYAMIARQDNENLYLLYSRDLHHWSGGEMIVRPRFAWEFIQIGNCGVPIELDEGWLLLTHGVGPVRKYAIGALLLDKNDPSIILARLSEPLIRPEPSEREGYVPNVVYTCGGIRHGGRIILPYAISDSFTNFATIRIPDLLAAMTPNAATEPVE